MMVVCDLGINKHLVVYNGKQANGYLLLIYITQLERGVNASRRRSPPPQIPREVNTR